MKRVHLRDAGMLQPPEHFGLVLEPAEDLRMAETAPQHFDRDGAPRPILLCRIDDAHAAGADGVQHQKAAEAASPAAAGHRPPPCRASGCARDRGSRSSGISSADDQRFDVAAQSGVVAAARVEKGARDRPDRRRRAPEKSLPRLDGVTACPSGGGWPSGPSARYSQARANAHSFFTVAGGQIERRRGFLDAQAGEVPQRHDLRLARVGLFEAGQRFVDGDEIGQAAGSARAIALPYLGVLIYLIAEHNGMADRNAAQMSQVKQQQDAYIKSVAGSSPADQIAQAKSLLDSGAISQAEFDSMKAKALEGAS